jgi:hypothetical protein
MHKDTDRQLGEHSDEESKSTQPTADWKAVLQEQGVSL